MTFVTGIGSYVPVYRIERNDVDPSHRRGGETAVPGPDETHVTMATEAAREALDDAEITGTEVDAVLAASVSDPFAAHGIAAQVAYHFGAEGDVRTGDFSSTSRASSDAFSVGLDVIAAGADTVLIIGVDILPAHLTDDEFVFAGAGAGALVLQSGDTDAVASVSAFGRETTGFVERHRKHGEAATVGDDRFERRHGIRPAAAAAIDRARPPDGSTPDRGVITTTDRRAAQHVIGDHANKLTATFDNIGYVGTASLFLDIALALERSEPEETVLAVGYGPGGADAIILDVLQKSTPSVEQSVARTEYVTYKEHMANRTQVTAGGVTR